MIRAGSPAPTRRGRPRDSARIRTSAPTSVIFGARMKTPRTGMVDALDVHLVLERIDLPAVGVALHADVHHREQGIAALDPPGQHDHAGARPEDRHALQRRAPGRARPGRRRGRAWPSSWIRRRGSPGSRPRRGRRRCGPRPAWRPPRPACDRAHGSHLGARGRPLSRSSTSLTTSRGLAGGSPASRSRARPSGRPGRGRASPARPGSRSSWWPRRRHAPSWRGPGT